MKRAFTVVWVLMLTLCMTIQVYAMQIFVKVNGKTVTLEVEETDSIEAIKAKIQEKEGISPDECVLTFQDAELNDETATLESLGIGRESTLYLTVEKRREALTGETDYDISYYGTYTDTESTEKIISMDIKWESMQFVYAAKQQGTWEPGQHSYQASSDSAGWVKNSADITVINHSNVMMLANLSFEPSASIAGSFSGTSLELENAVGTTWENAPSETVTFTVNGSMKESDGEKTLGKILIRLEPFEYLDLSNMEITADDVANDTEAAEAYKQKIREWLAAIDPSKAGDVTLNLKLSETTVSGLGILICDAVYEYYDKNSDGKVDLVCYGTERIAQKTFRFCGAGLKSIRFPDAVSMEADAFYYVGDAVKTMTFDKLTSISQGVFTSCSGLTRLKFGSVITSVSNFTWISNPAQVTLYLNPGQGDTDYGSKRTVFTSEGVTGSFGGVSTFAAVLPE